jgi:hypothetical protein
MLDCVVYSSDRKRQNFCLKEYFMAVHTSFFGVTKLTGTDSTAFQRQVTYGRPTKAARAALSRGNKLVKEFQSKGYVVVKIKTR